MSDGDHTPRGWLPTAITVLSLTVWSVVSYLTSPVDADIVAEAIQVQHWLQAPFWAMTYPGQPYGGVLEYPLLAIAETLTPGNPYGFTLIRIAYVPLVGLLICLNVRRLNASWSLWPIAFVAIAGPAVLHSQMAIKDLYPFSWLVAMAGVTVLYRQFSRNRSSWLLGVGGLLVGLAGYEHPTSLLFSIPMVVAGAIHWDVKGRRAVTTVLAIVIGLVVIVVQPARPIEYGTGQPSGPRLLEAFGLTQPTWTTAIVPDAWGLQFLDTNALRLPDGLQLAVNAALAVSAVLAVVAMVVAVAQYLRGTPARSYAYLAALWGTAIVVLAGLTVLIRPIYFYGASLAILVPVTLAALPSILGAVPRRCVVLAVVGLMAITSLGTLLGADPRFPDSISAKQQQVTAFRSTADAIADAGVEYIYGSYWEALPVAYASAGRLHPLTTEANRFPLDPSPNGSITVAVLDGTTGLQPDQAPWAGAQEALALARTRCAAGPVVTGLPTGVEVFTCPVDALRLD